MTPRSKLRRLDRKKESVLAHAEVKRLSRQAREDAGMSQEELGELVGISGSQVALRENQESNRNWTGAHLLKLFELLPGLREALSPAVTEAPSSSLEAAVTTLTLRAAELGAETVEAKADHRIMPSEADKLRRHIVQAERALANVKAALNGEASIRPIRSAR